MEDTLELNKGQKLAIFLITIGSTLNAEAAKPYLEITEWNVDKAINLYFSGQNIENEPFKSTVEHKEDNKSPKMGRGAWEPIQCMNSSKNSRTSELGSIRSLEVNSKDDGEEKNQDLFAGGGKSGTGIRMPDMPDNVNQLLQGLFNKASQPREQESDEEGNEPGFNTRSIRSVFTGTSNRLDAEPELKNNVDDFNSTQPQAPKDQNLIRQKVIKKLNFWKNGLNVEDGPLLPYNSPDGERLLSAINTGLIPLDLLNVQRDQAVDLQLNRRMEENYRAPTPPSTHLFSGTGKRVGNIVPSLARTQPPSITQSTSSITAEIAVDPGLPQTSVQIRLNDGSRLIGKFNHTHTIADLRAFIDRSRSNSENYTLQTSFPVKPLIDLDQTLVDAGILNAAIVQRNV